MADAAVLRDVRSLRRLDVAGNRLRDASVLGDLPQLVWLRVSGNPVPDFSLLARLTALRWLVLDAGASHKNAVRRRGDGAPLVLIENGGREDSGGS